MKKAHLRKRENKRKKVFLPALLGLTASLTMLYPEAFPAEALAAKKDYHQSATYYSDDWVVNFWNSESADMEEELAKVSENGFNSIILVVPWREFQPSMAPVRYQDYAFQKLDRVMKAAKDQDLDVFLRVGYTWDYWKFDGESSSLGRFRKLLYEQETKEAWMDYVSTVYQAVSGYENFAGGFLTWEDFWNFTGEAGAYGTGEESRSMAEKIGFTALMEERYPLEALNQLYHEEFEEYSQLYLPEKKSPAYRLFYEYYDTFLNQLLAESQQVFPDLSMEVRLDVDPVQQWEGDLFGYSHAATFGCQNSAYTSLMYSVSMGQQMEKLLNADSALTMMEEILENTRLFNGRKPLFIDQFLYMDNTPGFERNAKLEPGEISAFLTNSVPVLKGNTRGYGIWTYRDYGNNVVYNSQFGLGDLEWELKGSASIEESDGSKMAHLKSGGSVLQKMPGNVSPKAGSPVYVSFYAKGSQGAGLTVSLGRRSQEISLSEEGKTYTMEFAPESYQEICFSGKGDVYLDNVNVYTHVTEGELYHMNGEEGEFLPAIRELNKLLAY